MQRRGWIVQENSATSTISSAYEALASREHQEWANPHNQDEVRLFLPMCPVGPIVAAHPNMRGRAELVVFSHTGQTSHIIY